MTLRQKVSLCALNNAELCDAICRAHNKLTEFTEKLWICRDEAPRFYSGATTLALGSIDSLIELKPSGYKDGFHDADLSENGYDRLFSASWIWRNPSESTETILDWRRVETEAGLENWERDGWAAGDDHAPRYPRQFPSALLCEERLSFWSAYNDGSLVGGFIINITDPVVGVSNVFALPSQEQRIWSDIPNLSAAHWPNFPIVGYERGSDLELAISTGFERLSDLRVFVRQPDHS